MGWRELFAPPDRPAPGGTAQVVAIGVVLLAPLAIVYTWVDLAFNSATMAVPTSVTLGGYLTADGPPLSLGDGSQVTSAEGITVEVFDRTAVSLFYRTEELVAVGIVLVIILAAVISVAVLIRRPASRVVAGSLALLAVYFVYAAFAGPAARAAGERRIIRLLDLPTSDAETAADRFYVEPGLTDWHAWHGVFVTLAIVSLGAAVWVLHVRRLAQLSRTPTRHPGS